MYKQKLEYTIKIKTVRNNYIGYRAQLWHKLCLYKVREKENDRRSKKGKVERREGGRRGGLNHSIIGD